jgi:DeoR family suf operon transcriptional repressor
MLGMSPAAIRQHLATLDAFGLVSRRKVITKPSRPTYLYRASPEGMRTFPKRYDLLLTQLLEVLEEKEGPEVVLEVVRAAARRLAERSRGEFPRGNDDVRWDGVLEWLERQFSWLAEITTESGQARRITIRHCPFQDLPRESPDVCGGFFTTLLEALLGGVRVEHVPATVTPACCAFTVAPAPHPG